jgi:hypothetical protein
MLSRRGFRIATSGLYPEFESRGNPVRAAGRDVHSQRSELSEGVGQTLPPMSLNDRRGPTSGSPSTLGDGVSLADRDLLPDGR